MQVLAFGLVTGSTIALVALAFQLVYLPTKVLHIALGAVYVAAPYAALLTIRAGLPWYATMVAALLFAVAASIAIEHFNHQPLERRQASFATHILSSLGIYIAAIQIIVVFWGNQPKMLRSGVDPIIRFAGVILTQTQIAILVISLVTLVVFFLWLRFTDLGLRFRSLADNPRELALRGYSITRLRVLAFALSGLIAAIAALLSAHEIGFQPHAGLDTVILAIVATMIGGRTSFWGPVLAGLMLGIVRAEVVWIFSSRWQEGITFLVLVLFLLFRPQGLIARRMRLESGG